tara:strand:+ start:48 stop:413 length:366 start_codon:yes stop_codon:yes gene_type:complete
MIFTEKNRKLLFGVCLLVRLLIAIIPLYLSKKWLPYYGIIILSIGLSFLNLYFTNGRLKAPEGGGDTWWAKYRLIHGLLYLSGAIYLFHQERLASIPLLIDVTLGLVLFIFHRIYLGRIKT